MSLCRSEKFGYEVMAVKTAKSGTKFEACLNNELEALTALRHCPHIVQVEASLLGEHGTADWESVWAANGAALIGSSRQRTTNAGIRSCPVTITR
jgi:hypothetical protein